MTLQGIGLMVSEHRFPLIGCIALKAMSGIPSALRERLVFGGYRRQLALQRLLGGPRSLLVRYTRGPLLGLKFTCESTEKYFILGADFEHELIPVLRNVLKPTDVVYDIGANAGYWSLAFSRFCPKGAVYAFEPSPTNYARLEVNTAGAPNILPIRSAVSDGTGTARFSDRGSVSSIRLDGELEVKRMRLDDSNLPLPNFVKVDIEGHAGSAFCGAIDLLRRSKPIIICEIHNRLEEVAVSSTLGALGYRIENIEPERSFPFHVLATMRTA